MRAWLTLLFLGLFACGGSDGSTLFASGDDGGGTLPDGAVSVDAGSDALGALPDGTAPLSDLDAKCLGGPTGRQLLALLLPTYTSTFHSALDEGTGSALALGVAYANGAVGCAPGQTLCPPGGHGCYTTDPSVSLVVRSTFRTVDGAFRESLPGVVTWSPSSPDQIAWTATQPAASLAGTYTPTLSTRANVTMTFGAQLARSGSTSGSVSELVGTTSGGGGYF
jgi:hypothetical protein